MKIAVAGASGLIGTALVPALREDGHEVVRLVRYPAAAADEVTWDPGARILDPAAIADVDAAVNLAGAGVGDCRWTRSYKRTILESRINTTTTLAESLAAASPGPRVLLNASAVGWYGDTGDTVVDETAPAGKGFLADVCRTWESATVAAEKAGVRVAHLRTGLVCSRHGGLLGRLSPLVKAGAGGKLGSGRQYQPWISLRDEVDAIRFLLTADVSGPVNLTGPDPVRQADFVATMADVLHRPAIAHAPAFALRLALGQFADEGVLIGQRAVPAVLTAHGFRFSHPDVQTALRWAVG